MDNAYDLYWEQGISIDDLYRILFNLVYRFGNIFDRVYELANIINLNLVQPYIQPSEWEYIGGLIGRIGVEIFFPDYYPDIEIVYPDD